MVRFELNRSLTGMGHEHFNSAADAFGPRPAAELARRLFATDEVDAVHVFSNIVTVELSRGGSAEPLNDVMRTLYRYWQPGMAPPAVEDLVAPAEEAPAGGDSAGDGGGTNAATSEAATRVPAPLLERSRLGRERWKAKTGG